MKLTIVYEDIAVGAKTAFAPTASGAATWSQPTLLQTDKQLTVWSNPCELYSVALDGSATIMPDALLGEYALVSSTLSSADGTLPTPTVLTLTASGQYTSQGITLVFDPAANRYATLLHIAWYRGSTLIDEADFYPDATEYFCERRVDNYSRVVITFKKINMPQNRLYLTELRFGITRRFRRNEVEHCSILQEIDPVSHSISINTMGLTLKKLNNIDYLFQAKQPVRAYFDDELVATTFVKKYERGNDSRSYSIDTEDYISILDDSPFMGGMYTAVPAPTLLDTIFKPLSIPYELDAALTAKTLTGYIKAGSCREALRQAAFALGAVVDTSYSEAVRIYVPSTTVAAVLNKTNTFTGQRTTEGDKLTELRLTAYAYIPTDNVYTAYSADTSGTGTSIPLTFPEPLHSLSITNGTILSSGANHAVITANAGCVLTGKKYDVTQTERTVKNPLVLAADKENVKTISDMTLVNTSNAAALAQRCYDYYASRSQIDERILADGIRIGDLVTQEYSYMDPITGRIISAEYTVSGSARVAEVTIR